MYLSLTSSHTFDKVSFITIPNFDKIVHFGMYFGLMSVIILENRKTSERYQVFSLLALIALFYGILIEFMQSAFTTDPNRKFYDALFDFAGILVSVLLWFWLKPLIKQIIRYLLIPLCSIS